MAASAQQLAERSGERDSEQVLSRPVIEPAPIMGADDQGPAGRLEGRILLVSGRSRDCDAEQVECFSNCWKRKPPYPYQRGKADHHEYCSNKCLKAYLACLKEQNARALEFPTMQAAQDWLKRNGQDILAGTLVVVAGAVLVVVVVETGGLALVPLLAL
ncbi:hypothetical protein [Archangium sp.]|uniref:hypothetical protein n=1 Tax=Archangium sp. TaxID=1872627 RepID=UPI00286C3E73|nr:hypothetical protein [Archangium sp.]